ncbi:MAG: Pvc16 family protein [Syntrophothermus sp.]
MIADLDETIRQLLIAEVPIKNGEIEISFDQPKREWSSHLSRPTVNFFLYDLRENPALRTHQWERLAEGGNGGRLAHLKRTPFRVDCLYMLTTWAVEPEDEHRLLTRCLMALFRFPVLPEDRLVGSLRNPMFEIQARLASHDRLTNPAEVWASLDNEMRPTVSYIVTLALDPWSEVTGPVVHTLTYRFGQAAGLPDTPRLDAPDPQANQIYISGTVWAKSKPQVGIAVAVKGTGLFTKTDRQGRFVLGSLPSGEYTLVAWPPKGKPREKKVAVPAAGGTYDLEIGQEEP